MVYEIVLGDVLASYKQGLLHQVYDGEVEVGIEMRADFSMGIYDVFRIP